MIARFEGPARHGSSVIREAPMSIIQGVLTTKNQLLLLCYYQNEYARGLEGESEDRGWRGLTERVGKTEVRKVKSVRIEGGESLDAGRGEAEDSKTDRATGQTVRAGS